MDLNCGVICGTVQKVETATRGETGVPMASVDLETRGFSQGRETTYAMSFTFFREAAQMAQRIAPGDYVVVQFRLRVNQRGYADICTTGIIPVARQTGAPMRDSRQLEDLPF